MGKFLRQEILNFAVLVGSFCCAAELWRLPSLRSKPACTEVMAGTGKDIGRREDGDGPFGNLRERRVRETVCAVMEGGREAFEQRYRRISLEGRNI